MLEYMGCAMQMGKFFFTLGVVPFLVKNPKKFIPFQGGTDLERGYGDVLP